MTPVKMLVSFIENLRREYSNIASPGTTGYDALVMPFKERRFQRLGLLLMVAILTVTNVAALVHWHVSSPSGNDERGCVLCHVRHEPGIDNPVTTTLAVPVTSEFKIEIGELQRISRESAPVRSGRAPPHSI